MQCKLLLQATSLLLLSAAVFAQVESMAALPAEVRTAATNCYKEFGAQCRWGDSCATIVPNCQLCENQQCAYCKAGYFLDTEDNTCTECPQGGYCGGKSTDPTEPDSKWACEKPTFTDGPGKWSPSQCSTCFVGYGHAHGSSSCAACEAGTAKNLVGEKECDFCLDGFIANANKGATDCINIGCGGGRRLKQSCVDPEEADDACAEVLETDVDEPALYIADENSCGCPPWSVLETAQVEYNEDKDWSVVPPRCIATCDEGKVFSITGEPVPGLTECKTCPKDSVAAPDARSCVCKPGLVAKPDFENDGCKAAPAPGPAPGDDDEEEEWGHWSHKKGNKHGKKHHEEHKDEDEEEHEEHEDDRK